MQKETTIEDLYNYYRGSILRSYLEIHESKFCYSMPVPSRPLTSFPENNFEKTSLYFQTDT